jgi:hypothetical protein
MLGSLLLPQMLEQKYDPKTAMGPILAIRRRRYPDPALGARRPAGKPGRDLDLSDC